MAVKKIAQITVTGWVLLTMLTTNRFRGHAAMTTEETCARVVCMTDEEERSCRGFSGLKMFKENLQAAPNQLPDTVRC